MKKFRMEHSCFPDAEPEFFTEDTAPDWLTSVNTVKGSTMDHRIFWTDYVLKLEVGGVFETDFRTIIRIE